MKKFVKQNRHPQKNRFQKSFLALAALFLVQACSQAVVTGGVKDNPVNQDDQLQNLVESANVGVRTFDQINQSMSAVTRVGMHTNDQLRAQFEGLRNSLPLEYNVGSFGPSQILSSYKIAYHYCRVAVERELDTRNNSHTTFIATDPENRLFPSVDLTQGFSQFESDESRQILFSHMLDRVWGRHDQRPSYEEVEDELNSLYQDLIVDLDPNSLSQMWLVLKGICTAALAASPVGVF